MYEILDSGLARIGEVEQVSSDNHSLHWQSAGTLTLIAAATQRNLQGLRNDRFVLIRDNYGGGDRLDGLYVICSVQHDEEQNELTVNGKAAPYLLHRRAMQERVLSATTAGAALSGLVNSCVNGLPIIADFASDGDPAVVRYPMGSGAVDDACEKMMQYCGIGMAAVLDNRSIHLTYSSGRDLSADASVPVLGTESGRARNTSLTVDISDFYNVAVGTLAFSNGNDEAFSVGNTDAQGAARRELYIGEIAQKSGEPENEFRDRAAAQANATLAARLLRTTINVDIFPADYGRPYLVGDMVRVQVGPVTIKKRITGATWLCDQLNNKLSLTLGDQLYTIVAEIVAEIKDQEKASGASTRAGGAAKQADENKDAIVGIKSDYKSLIASVDGLVAGMDAYVLEKVFEEYKFATANLFAALKDEDKSIKSELSLQAESIEGVKTATADLSTRVDGAESGITSLSESTGELWKSSSGLWAAVKGADARITVNADNISGIAGSVATIQADVIQLQGDTQILGNLSVDDGGVRVSKSVTAEGAVTGTSVYANGYGTQGIVSGRRVSCREIAVNGKEYISTEITSTSGAVLVLGTA